MFNFFRDQHVKDLTQITKFLRLHLDDFDRHRERVPEDLYDVTCFLMEENIDLYEAMGLLMRKHHFRSCIPLARSLLENAVTLKYIYATDSEKRAQNLKKTSQHSYLQRVRKQEDTETRARVLEVFEGQLGDFNPRKDRASVKTMFTELGMERQYDEWYGRLSEFAHSRYRGNRDMAADRPFNNFMRQLVFKHVLLLILESIRVATERFDLDGGVMIIEDYPETGAVFFYSTNPKKMGPIGFPG
jgi:hypothetical protein